MPTNGAYSPYDLERAIKAVDYIQVHYAETLSPDSIAEEFSIDIKKLQLVMQVLTGHTVHNYQLNIRIEQAKLDLADCSKPIKFIARKQGFNTATHFNRKFKQWMGITPKQYRYELMALNNPSLNLELFPN
jgi:AraC-like DNA-binding protein